MKNIFLIKVFILFFLSHVIGQDDRCHADIDWERSATIQKLLKQNQQYNAKNYNGETPMIRLVLHNVHQDDGSEGFNWSQIRTVVQGSSDFFSTFGICFTVISENDIDNTTLYNISNYFNGETPNPDWENLIQEDRIENAINIYFLESGQGGIATGFLFGDDFPTVTLGGGEGIFSSEILSHELGHCLGLFHTHQTRRTDPNDPATTIREQIPRTGNLANCTTEGDLLCDTPADPFLAISTANVDENSCNYIGGAMLNGFSYTPDTRNIMSYTLIDCMLDFTEEQGARMRNFILNSTVLDDYVIRENRTVEGTITAANRYYGVEGTITTTANHIYPDVLYEAGEAVNLEVGFDIDAVTGGTVEARIGDYSCLEPLTRNDARVGNPNQPIANTNGVRIIKSRDIIEEAIFDESLIVSPNPFNNSFNLSFDLSKTEAVSLVVYNALGRVVETVLRNDNLQAGNHQYKINGSGLENGLYYVTLRHSSGTQTIKIVKQ